MRGGEATKGSTGEVFSRVRLGEPQGLGPGHLPARWSGQPPPFPPPPPPPLLPASSCPGLPSTSLLLSAPSPVPPGRGQALPSPAYPTLPWFPFFVRCHLGTVKRRRLFASSALLTLPLSSSLLLSAPSPPPPGSRLAATSAAPAHRRGERGLAAGHLAQDVRQRAGEHALDVGDAVGRAWFARGRVCVNPTAPMASKVQPVQLGRLPLRDGGARRAEGREGDERRCDRNKTAWPGLRSGLRGAAAGSARPGGAAAACQLVQGRDHRQPCPDRRLVQQPARRRSLVPPACGGRVSQRASVGGGLNPCD